MYLAVAACMIPRRLTHHNVARILEHNAAGSTALGRLRLAAAAVLKFTLIPAACLRPDHNELNHKAVGSSKFRTAVQCGIPPRAGSKPRASRRKRSTQRRAG